MMNKKDIDAFTIPQLMALVMKSVNDKTNEGRFLEELDDIASKAGHEIEDLIYEFALIETMGYPNKVDKRDMLFANGQELNEALQRAKEAVREAKKKWLI